MKSLKIEEINRELQPFKSQLIDHPIYHKINSFEGLKSFSEVHIYAVWDFMSLLKSLQNGLTCISLPWKPVGTADIRYLINEIVLGEESDVDQHGQRTSHFELYKKAMVEMGANTSEIDKLIANCSDSDSIFDAIEKQNIHPNIKEFLSYTFEIALNAPLHVKAAVFTFGREDLIPDMFLGILNSLKPSEGYSMDTFKYYIERHIEIDGDHHSLLAYQMVDILCGDDTNKWNEALEASKISLQKRIGLWNVLL